jgi:hypothetical protein
MNIVPADQLAGAIHHFGSFDLAEKVPPHQPVGESDYVQEPLLTAGAISDAVVHVPFNVVLGGHVDGSFLMGVMTPRAATKSRSYLGRSIRAAPAHDATSGNPRDALPQILPANWLRPARRSQCELPGRNLSG